MYLSVCAALLIPACSSEKEITDNREKYPVTNPVVMDTVYTNDYVADIHSLQHVEIRTRVKGYIEKIHVDEGEIVKDGQILFSLSSQKYEIDLLQAKAMLKSAFADAKAAELDLQNVKMLVEKNIVSKTELKRARSKLDALHAKVNEAKSYVASAELNLSYTAIRAPFNGIIDRIPNKVGSLVDEGTLLTTLSDNKEVFAYFNVSEKEYLDFTTLIDSEKKNDVTLVLANNQIHSSNGCIETVAGTIDKDTGNIAFRACFPNPDLLLKHGSSGKVRVIREEKNALIIPQKATFEIQDKVYVFTVDSSNTVKMKSIVPKLRIPHLYVIESGLSSHDRIVYEGIQLVKEGDKIIPEVISMKQILAQSKEQTMLMVKN
ncbi:putative multidrug efflux pump [Candidatus Jettenia caeni]|uniref:Putative multidrug efflux pump n=2 Tax=Candidatus Jettenia TaxID=360731 RepID=I3IRG7_9BACT|nr:putative multidrug efflux pump [Candidatus Jettenia caeni]GIL19760.1 MAG: hemolysin D [Candidatus Jettenia caeni]GJQ45515.1 MAG: hemolysin D [Candidatus Jettenia caeni]